MIYWISLVVCVILVGRIFDYLLTGLHIPAVVCVIALIASLATGGAALMTTRVGMPLLCLIGWMLLCAPFSSWRGDSVTVVMYFSFFSLMWLPVALGPRSMKDILRLILLLAALNLVTLNLTKNDADGRLQGIGASFANSEDIALVAVLSIPFVLLCAGQRGAWLMKLLALPWCLFLVRQTMLTGSRAALLALLGMAAVYFIRSSMAKKLLLVVAGAGVVVFIAFTVTPEMIARLATVTDAVGVSSSGGGAVSSEAADSARARHQLLMDSIRLTFQHPVFGVGPGQFAIFRWTEDHAAGVNHGFFVTHNAYTEVSSEQGLPGLIFFVMLLIGTMKTLHRARKLNVEGSHPAWQQGQMIASSLQLSFVSMMIFGFFLANAQYIFWYLFGGLGLALERITLHQIALAQGAAAGPPYVVKASYRGKPAV